MELESFLFMILLSQILPFSTQNDNQPLASTCPKKFDCAELGNLSFPFTNLSYLDCGLWMADCSNKAHPNISFHSPWDHWYEAKSVGNSTINVSSPYLKNLLSKRSCKTFIFDIPNSPSISYTILGNITLFRCPSYPNLSYQFPGHGKYGECPDSTVYYRFPNTTCQTPESVPPCSVYHLPSNKSFTDNNESLVHDVFDLLDSEFVLEWHVSKDCYDCHSKGGNCGTDRPFHCSIDESMQSGLGNKRLGIILGSAGAALVLLALAIFLIWRRKKGANAFRYLISRNTSEPSSKLALEAGSFYCGVSVFSYSELEEATHNFDASRELGDGGFGTVYYGKLRDGREVAVKRLYEHNLKRMEQFKNEIQMLTRLRHRNLVTLYGCTPRHSRELLLVYEYILNGTVADHLHGDRAKDKYLTWSHRMNIAIETADALAYLHASDTIHRDVTTNNILLDHNFCVKVADFGLSRPFPNHVSYISTTPQGTPGYVDPEYHEFYQLTDKSDVYSFGVVMIELISSMPAVDITRHRHEINLANLAINRIQRSAFDELIDPGLGHKTDAEVLRMTTSVAEVAFRCLQGEKEMRPTMEEVLESLKEIQAWKVNSTNNAIERVDGLRNPRASPSPESEDRGLLKNLKLPTSPDSVTNAWASSSTATSNSS